jgi:hypothetical protein
VSDGDSFRSGMLGLSACFGLALEKDHNLDIFFSSTSVLRRELRNGPESIAGVSTVTDTDVSCMAE